MKRLILLCAVASVAGAGGKKAPSDEKTSLCTDNTEGQLDVSGRCRCECNTGPEGGGPCAFYTIKGHYHGAENWCPPDSFPAPKMGPASALVRLAVGASPGRPTKKRPAARPAAPKPAPVTPAPALPRARAADVESAPTGAALVELLASGPATACVRYIHLGAAPVAAHLQADGFAVPLTFKAKGSEILCPSMNALRAGTTVRLVLDAPLTARLRVDVTLDELL